MSLTFPLALGLATGLLCIGLFGVVWRRDAAGSLASLALTGAAAVASLVIVSAAVRAVRVDGQAMALLVLVVVASQVVLGLVMTRRSHRESASAGDHDVRTG